MTTITIDGTDQAHYQYEQGRLNLQEQIDDCSDPDNVVLAFKNSQSLGYRDPYRERFREEAHNSTARWILFYHWISSQTDVEGQAANYINALGGKMHAREGIMLDDEEQVRDSAGVLHTVTPERSVQFLDIVERELNRPGSADYTGAYVAGGRIWQNKSLFNGDRLRWLAAYTSERNMLNLPGMKNEDMLPDLWQLTSSGINPLYGRQMRGVTARCDLNMMYSPGRAKPLLNRICGLNIPAPPVIGKPIPYPINNVPNLEAVMKAHIVKSAQATGFSASAILLEFETGYVMVGLDQDPNGDGQTENNVAAYFGLGGARLNLDNAAFHGLETKQGLGDRATA